MKILPTYTKKEISPEELERTSERFLQEMFQDELRRKWGKRLRDEHQLDRVQTGKRRVILRWVAGIAATLLLAVAAWQWLSPQTPNKQELLALYLQDHFSNAETRKSDTAVDELRQEAISAYKRKDFQQAAILRQQLVDKDSALIKDDFFYLGLSYLYQQPPNTKQAITWLLRAQEMPGRKYQLEGQWSLALAYLAQGEDEKARPILEVLVTGQQWKTEEAAALLLLFDSRD